MERESRTTTGALLCREDLPSTGVVTILSSLPGERGLNRNSGSKVREKRSKTPDPGQRPRARTREEFWHSKVKAKQGKAKQC